MPRPEPSDAAEFYHRYISYVQGSSVKEIIAGHANEIYNFYNSLPGEKASYAYAPGKWSIIQVLQHVIDAERVFSYRALRFARKDTTPLAGFDENSYAANDEIENRTLDSLKEEFNALRTATNIFYTSLSEDQLNCPGTASGSHITVNAIVFITYGHLLHHKKIIQERYL